jgi:hypothetical protein
MKALDVPVEDRVCDETPLTGFNGVVTSVRTPF